MKLSIAEILGWIGALFILAAYGLTSLGVLTSTSLLYQLLNLTGAACVCYISLIKKAYQPAILNAVWFIVAVIAIVRLF